MARERLSMRKVKELVRLTYGFGLSQRHVANSFDLSEHKTRWLSLRWHLLAVLL